MNITLYKTQSENERVSKVLTNALELEGNLRNESNVINPSIMLEGENLAQYNYVYIEEFDRYYFVNEITSVRTNLWNMSLHVDVLMSYSDEIRNQNAVIDKQQETTYTTELYNDGSFRAREDVFLETKSYPNGFNNDGKFVLLVAGAIEAQ